MTGATRTETTWSELVALLGGKLFFALVIFALLYWQCSR